MDMFSEINTTQTDLYSTQNRRIEMSNEAEEDSLERFLELQEEQYKFGSGPVVLRRLRVVAEVEFDGVRWWRVKAEVANGNTAQHGSWINREIYVATLLLDQPPSRPHE